jgi:flagellar biogenesis protein FliO
VNAAFPSSGLDFTHQPRYCECVLAGRASDGGPTYRVVRTWLIGPPSLARPANCLSNIREFFANALSLKGRGRSWLAIVICICAVSYLSGRAFAQSASTPAASERLNVTPPPVDPNSVENKNIRPTNGNTAGQADSSSGSTAPGFDAAHVAGALALVVVLIVGLRFLAKRFFALPTVRTSSLVKVLARSPVSPKQQVLLLHVGRRILVVADSGSTMHPLAQITDADEIAALLGQLNANAHFGRSPFAPLLNKLRGEFDPDDLPAAPEVTGDLIDGAEEPASAPAEVTQTTQELQGLMEKVRLVSRRLGRTG